MTIAWPAYKPATYIGRMGLAEADMTPPVGIYNRAWGAAAHDVAAGIHQPLTATALAILPENRPPRLLIAADICWVSDSADYLLFRSAVAEAVGTEIDNVLLAVSHTHAAPPLDRGRLNMPGGHLLEPYLAQLEAALVRAAQAACARAVPAQLVVTQDRCQLAVNRDLPVGPDQYACGFHPDGTADDALLVGRITARTDGRLLGTLVNYACHPTTLSWENELISPDYVGAMRQVVAAATAGSPCLFIQGASGELSARECHQGETGVAERHGRQLGYAVLSALEGMLPPGEQLNYMGLMESGARLAYWRPAPLEVSERMRQLESHSLRFELPIKASWPSLAEFTLLHDLETDRVLKERYFRRTLSRQQVGDGPTFAATFHYWRLGEIFLTTTPTEMYSSYQQALRAVVPDNPLLVGNLVNGSYGYIVPEPYFESDLYQAEMTPFAPGALAEAIQFSGQQLVNLAESTLGTVD